MASQTIERVKLRKNFYRDHFRSGTTILMATLILMMAIVVTMAYLYFSTPRTRYYATLYNGALYSLQGYDEANESSEYILN